jgi:tetratricopeptide (TPR) repeat protein
VVVSKVNLEKANASFEAKNYHEALRLYQYSDTTDMTSVSVYRMGLCYFHLNDSKSAALHFQRVVERAEGNFFHLQSLMLLGTIAAQAGNYGESENHLYVLLRKNYENAQIYAILGYIYNQRKDYAQAEYYYKKSVALEPTNPNSHNGLGYNYLEWNKDVDKGFEHIRRAVEYDSENYAYLDSLGWFYFLKSNFSKALFYITKSLRLKSHKVSEAHLREVQKKQAVKPA